jgi:adenylate cyclase
MEGNVYTDLWYWYLTGEKRRTFSKELEAAFIQSQRLFRLFPGRPRCFECGMPLHGAGSFILKPFGSSPSSFSPRFCSRCESIARKIQAGAEVELSLLFADVRGSTPLAERTSTSSFEKLIRRFYKATTDVLIDHLAMVNRLIGDQVSGIFVPRFAGKDHAKVAIHAAQELLRVTGHEDPSGPWIPLGAGVHTGTAYVGAVGSKEGVNEIGVLGSAANLAARLSSQANTGEILVSDSAAQAAVLNVSGLESRRLELKGISQPVSVYVLQASQQVHP